MAKQTAKHKKVPKKGLRGVLTADRFVKDGIKARLKLGPFGESTSVEIGVKVSDDVEVIVGDTALQADRGYPISIRMNKKEALELAARICQQVAEQV